MSDLGLITQHLSVMTVNQWERMLTRWLTNLTSPRTRKAYYDSLLQWQGFIQDISQAQSQDVIDWRDYLVSEGKQPTTINLRLSAIRAMYAEAVKAGLIAVNPADGVRGFNIQKYGKAFPLDKEELIRLLAVMDDRNEKGARDKALFLFLVWNGFRVAVAENVLWSHLKGASFNYVVKGGKPVRRNVPKGVLRALEHYKSFRGDDCPQMFKSTRKAHCYGIKQPTIWRLLQAYLAKAGLDPRRVHDLRHTAANLAYKAGAGLGEINALLNHENLETTLIYLQSISKDPAGAMSKLDWLGELDNLEGME